MRKSKKQRNKETQRNTKKQKFNKKIKGGNFNYFCIIIMDNKDMIDKNKNIIINLYSSKKESKGRAIAYIYLKKMSENTIKIEDFQVYNENNRKKGYGSYLLKYTIKFIKQNTSYTKLKGELSRVDKINELFKFYSRFGFVFKKNMENTNSLDYTIKLDLKNIENMENITFTDNNTLVLNSREYEKYG
jgi:predicted GNAT family N-acyltransferase